MSSAIRSMAKKNEGIVRFFKLQTPCYDNGEFNALFPFTYENGVLDISYAGNNFKQVMVDTPGQDPSDETATAVQTFGSVRLVHSLGDNFKSYIRAWRSLTIDVNSPIEVYMPCQVLRVQEGERSFVNSYDGPSYRITTTPPAGDNYTSGDGLNEFNSKYIFKSPLTITIKEGGVTKYITFNSMLDQED
jgi:hypothetical protein